jgi:5-methylcytosine-specific restriction endonuclease McrBC regulatory subunit McrC
VVDAVGVLAVEGLQLTIAPKIPAEHFLEIVSRSSRLPTIAAPPGAVQRGAGFAELLCLWFVGALERIVAEGLLQDYREVTEETAAVRGRLQPLATARSFYRGRLAVTARFDEFGYDHPLNRILQAAARTVSGAPFLSDELRRRATRMTMHLPEVSAMTPADLTAQVDRSSAHYADGILLAKEVIASAGRSLSAGDAKTWTFLFRTAIPIEEGLRAILSEAFRPFPVRRSSFPIGAPSMRANPDLSFGAPAAIGDVKYKIGDGTWTRTDLYQLVAFAAAAGVKTALLVDFRPPSRPPLPALKFGDIAVLNASWPLLPGESPTAARDELVQEAADCLGLPVAGP